VPDAAAPDAVELRLLAEAVAREAGALLHDGLDAVRLDVGTKSSLTDMVTEMDRAAEALIVERLLGIRPDDGMLGEEGTDEPGTSGIRWVVDPLDGTTNYLYGLPGFNVSIAAEHDGVAVAGVVFDVVRGELFSATLGGGATRDGSAIHASDAAALPAALIGTGFSYDSDRRRKQAAVLVEVLPHVRDIRRSGAAAIDLCSVACGRLDGFYEKGLAPWDLAAGGLIAAEAGAVVQPIGGGRPNGSVVAAAPAIAAALHELVQRAGAADA
jgi:myo-inositol-1(or 4)-monophosphatase